MKSDEQILERFNDLTSMGDRVLTTRVRLRSSSLSPGRNYGVDTKLSTEWGILCLNLISSTFTKDSDHYQKFDQYFGDCEKFDAIQKCVGVLQAAKSDYQNGYLNKVRTLIEGEVFDDFLEQAEHLLSQSYFTASAVIAGSVLEDGLRKLCVNYGIALSAKPKLDTMNAELAKAGVYNLLKQKQITALADLRNKAAHGQGGFTKEDVESMIKDVRRFTVDYFS
jgi:hypothetical protein